MRSANLFFFTQPQETFEAWHQAQQNTPFEEKEEPFFVEIQQQPVSYGSVIDTSYADSLYWKEQHLYGSSRLGIAKPELEVTNYTPSNASTLTTNFRNYELTNHLGNVLSTIKDEKQQIDQNADGIVDYYEPIVITANDYYPFGMLIPNRSFSLAGSNYRFGFNGKEKESDMYGEGNAIDFGARVHDARTGRFLSLDPLSKKYPMHSNYSYSANNPIYFIEVGGKYFTGNTEVLNKHITMLKTSSSNEAKKQLADIQRMQQSDIEFNIQDQEYSTDIFQSNERNAAGSAMFDFENNRMNIKFDEEHSRLSHELEHGRQFMDGEIDFKQTPDGKTIPGDAYDKTDEFKAYKVQQEFENNKDKMSDIEIKRHIDSDPTYRKLEENPQTLIDKYDGLYQEKEAEKTGGKYKNTYNYTPTENQKIEKQKTSENVKF